MIIFLDGPAQGQRLMLKRAPILLRVVRDGAKWDALDQLEDTPKPTEEIFVYEQVGTPSWAHICRSPKAGGSGMFMMAEYQALVSEHPPAEDALRDNRRWREWAAEEAKRRGTGEVDTSTGEIRR